MRASYSGTLPSVAAAAGTSSLCVTATGSGSATGGKNLLPAGARCTFNAACASGVCGPSGTGNCCAQACATSDPLCGAIACDALKLAYLSTGRRQYMDIFRLFSRFGKFLSWQVRIGSLLRLKPVRACVRVLASYWDSRSC